MSDYIYIDGVKWTADELIRLIRFRERLRKSQVDLPPEAARVLRDNLWNLYE